MSGFKLKSDWLPAGDQPEAIKQLTDGLQKGMRYQTLLGVTGSGKTFTVANVIQHVQKPTLVIAHNKTLAAQLAQEYRSFFPENAVHYFVSYYDYYQPEAYLPTTDTYIEKDAQINEEIDRLRHASTQALLSRPDVIIVASVSCIYGLGSPDEYLKVNLKLALGDGISRNEVIRKLVNVYFDRTNADLRPGTFRGVGNTLEVMPTGEVMIYQLTFSGSTIESIMKIDPITRAIIGNEKACFFFPAKHFITPEDERKRAVADIRIELGAQLKAFDKEKKLLEAERLKRRTKYDIAMIEEVGYCSGIENYSRHFSGKAPGEPPETLLSYFPHAKDGSPDFLTVIDESHVTVPQLRGMYAGDQSRKKTLVEHGFRLPSACDNRPLKFDEWGVRVGQVLFTSATPADFEREVSEATVEQVIRPTGLVDPEIDVRPIVQKGNYPGQIADFINEATVTVKNGGRILVTTLTKKMAEDLAAYLKEKKVKAEYLHSDVKTIDRIKILTEFRKGTFDCLVGVNLLREGLDLPEVSLVAILDADKEGFLRSETSLIQTIGRAARNVLGRVLLYADVSTGSLAAAIGETNRRRAVQVEYNRVHGITPQSIKKKIKDITEELQSSHDKALKELYLIDQTKFAKDPAKLIRQKEKEMTAAAKELDFETAALLRDEIALLKGEPLHPNAEKRPRKRR
ncbi:MAG: excinuclease ABC subunit B [Candidatus Lloydbacteria bacterium RIFCSPHIGHO2_02_FULL_54_17]|uniref:UvrABC system protein B n=1 Tax=Candidatus Lloydbacteria bacterium RIFCSPHIGHO2_02_FULL_54_17 TaxID=1798664 RepID=A0A1G2DIZ2_9BACT|nr:MAG: excinuclease ABC subunit B [Candidatus Lloydbacteria bacterium RIFCSPHIGHO2_01_FULL_54_11]OGZ13579.1 MAG: excinuclease ABC subunit B [Candidatus Lloydbacteria bacterium RIFCSPHIGHO2_02_FULL_54_17]OGZ15416.1 MAG: excinuclease ABC subunit B [Candidatus Lloydbacteria bacterium RIFCSPLOWO2_01_FULL_54_18]OGZ16253.1 MAG: excinuclease ABC subunit B [Candidatus Lloydbacteria bacterium RIFCSPLOWO2_02_FULL_54_12]